MSDLGRVVVLAGGLSHERDVSIRSGRRVADALRSAGVEVQVRDIDAALLPALLADRPDAVFPTLHGATGEDGAVQGILALLGVPYVGSSAAACRRAFDKPSAKDAIRTAGLATPDWVAIPKSTFRDLGTRAVLDAVTGTLPLPLFVKPARGGSSLGAAAVQPARNCPAAMVACFAYDETALIERLVTGREISVVGRRHRRGPAGAARRRDRRATPASTTTPPGTPPASPSSSRPPDSLRTKRRSSSSWRYRLTPLSACPASPAPI